MNCALKATAIRGRFQGLLGEIAITQTYQNDEAVNIEAVFTFPVPADAVLLGVDIRINDRVLQGQVLPKRQAENAYEDAVSSGDRAILLQDAGRGLYTLNAGNLLPGERAEMGYRYALLQVWNGDTLRFHLPTTVAPRYGDPVAAGLQPHQVPVITRDAENRFQLELTLSGPLRQAAVESPSHRIGVAIADDAVRVTLAGGLGLMDRDFILNIRCAAEARAAFGLYAPDQDGWIALACFQPDLTGQVDTQGRPVVLIADCSGSMAGVSIAQTRQALLAILDRLQPADRFNLIAFGTEARAFFGGLHPANASGLAQARALVAGLDADMGGTELGVALQRAYRQSANGQPLDLLLITDGEVWGVDKLIAEAKRSGCRLFTVGVGAAVAEELVRGLAEATGGACERVHPNEDMADRIVRHFERIRAPRAEATVHWPVEPSRRLPESVERVFNGDTLHLLAWLPQPPAGPATLTLTLNDGHAFSQRVPLEPWPSAETDDILARVGAARRIAAGLPAPEATALAVDYQLVTPHTHFLMVDVRADADKAKALPELRPVAHRLAAGWGGMDRAEITGRNVCADSDYLDLDIPAFLRRSPDSPSPAPMAASLSPAGFEPLLEPPSPPPMPGSSESAGIESLKDWFHPLAGAKRLLQAVMPRSKTEDESKTPDAASAATRFARWLEANGERLADSNQPLPSLDELADAGLPDDLGASLQALVAQGEAEAAVVAALLYAFLQHGPRCNVPRSVSRSLRSRFQKQVTPTLTTAVEARVKAWCIAG